MNINRIIHTTIFLITIVLLLVSCNKEDSYESVMKELSTEEEGLYNLYFFHGNDKDSKKIYKNFQAQWEASEHMSVYNTRNYNISDGYGNLNKLYFDTLNINQESVPTFILFDNNGIVLKTKKINMVLLYLKNINNE